MEEEVFARDKADGLTARIADRLGERQQKLEQMAAWEKSARQSKVRPLYYLTAIAACVLAVVLMWPTHPQSPIDELGIEVPSMTTFRDASPEVAQIEQMMGEERWDDALKRAAKLLKASDLAIYELENVPEIWSDEEEMLYEDRLERVKNGELRWVYIYLLVRQGENKLARKELKTYLKFPEYCDHEQEARQLLEKLKKAKN